MMKKRLLAAMISAAILLSWAVPGLAAEKENMLPLILNGVELDTPAEHNAVNLYLPLRAVAEGLGYTVSWSAESDAILVSKNAEEIAFDLQNLKIRKSGHESGMIGTNNVSGLVNIDGRIYLADGILSEVFGLRISLDETNQRVTAQSLSGNPVIITTMALSSKTDFYTLNLQIPQFYGLSDSTVQDNINACFRKAALNAQQTGMQNAYEFQKYIAQGDAGSPNRCETYFDYRIKYNQNGLLSVVLSDYQYSGGAHGGTLQSSCNFDLKTGKSYSLSDLMKNWGYESVINKEVRRQMDERKEAGLLTELTPFESIRDDQDYYLSGDGIVIYFQQYEYFPYAAGIQEFKVEYSKLKDYIKDDFQFLWSN